MWSRWRLESVAQGAERGRMSESSRERLIQIADRLFYEHGFHAIGIDRVISEVGVTKTTFYNHFESKDDLILAVLDARDQR